MCIINSSDKQNNHCKSEHYCVNYSSSFFKSKMKKFQIYHQAFSDYVLDFVPLSCCANMHISVSQVHMEISELP